MQTRSMFEYTSGNHFRFGYDDRELFCNRRSPGQTFKAWYGRCKKNITDWRTANSEAALEIYEKAAGPVWILLSGGTDSEICVRTFLQLKIPFQVATIRFKDNLNAHDILFVEKLRRELPIDVTYFDLDVASFFESSNFYEIVDKIQCVSPILACHLWLADQLDGVPVIAQGEPHLKKDIPHDYEPGVSPYLASPWRLLESERLCSLYKHFIFKNRPAIPGFFQYRPEQVWTYLRYNPIMNQLVSNQIVGKLGTRSSKNRMANQFYPDVALREKYTGFENLNELHDLKRHELAMRFPHSDSSFSFEFNELEKALRPIDVSSDEF